MVTVHTIIVAAGSGSRFGGSLPKQFCDLDGKPVLMHTIDAVREALPCGRITLVLSEPMFGLWTELCAEHKFHSPQTAAGGASRFESVANGLQTIEADTDIIMVHDGARPLPAKHIFSNLVEALSTPGCQGAIPAVAVTDSLRRVSANGVSASVDRSAYRAVQTPQAFHAFQLLDAYAAASGPEQFTDDASVMEAAGYTNIALVAGNVENIKITNPGDIALATFYLKGKL